VSIAPQLSSVSSGLDELTKRVTMLAESLDTTQQEHVAAALFEVERSLATAGRRLEQLLRDLR
jgi:predicted transcriptional regulator